MTGGVRLRSALAGLALLVPALAACSGSGGDDGRDAARDTTRLLARQLQRHTLSRVPLVDPAGAATFEKQVAGLSTYRVRVQADDLRTEDRTGTARLRWSWRIGAQEWTYDTTARLVRSGEEWRVRWRPDLLAPDLTSAERLRVTRTPAARAAILGAGGEPIVTERPVVRFGLDRSRLAPGQVASSARRLARVLGIRVGPFVEAARAAGPRAFVEALVLREDDARGVAARLRAIPGALGVDDTRPLAPTRDFGAELLGQVGPATAELVEKSDGRVVPGDEVGLSGLQARYDERLGGAPATEVRAVTVACAAPDDCTDTDAERVLADWEGTPGRPLRLTLDPGLQDRAERILADASRTEDRLRSSASAIVALRPSTGALLVAANGPGNDGLNAATFGRYAPGSTFKIVSSLALLRAGLRPGDTVSCPARVVVDGRRFKNYDDYPASALGRITYRSAIAHSCNTAVIGQRDRLRPRDLADAAAALGLGVDHDLGFPAYFGQVPAPAGETEEAADLIGQGKVLSSPLTMASVAASVAAGHAVVPYLVEGTRDAADPRVPLTAQEARELRDLMRAVVTEGSGGFLASLPGEVGAKTGTAEYGTPRRDGTLATHAWMIATRGDLAVAVFVEDGESGSGTAGPLLERFLRGG